MSESWEPLVCPVCWGPLSREERALRCENGHCFDLASGGYVNLLLGGKAGAGDGLEMVEARRAFLERGYYAPFRDRLADTASAYAPPSGPVTLLDAGCGEGYYTAAVVGRLRACGREVHAAGIDLSKAAVRRAAKRDAGIRFAVAGIFGLPVAQAGVDILLNVFAPAAGREFLRVLRPGGALIVAAPGRRHLFGLKEILYDRPYENEKNRTDFPGFEPAEEIEVNYPIHLTDREDILRLFTMTPYCWRTPARWAERLDHLSELETPAEFAIRVFRKS